MSATFSNASFEAISRPVRQSRQGTGQKLRYERLPGQARPATIEQNGAAAGQKDGMVQAKSCS